MLMAGKNEKHVRTHRSRVWTSVQLLISKEKRSAPHLANNLSENEELKMLNETDQYKILGKYENATQQQSKKLNILLLLNAKSARAPFTNQGDS